MGVAHTVLVVGMGTIGEPLLGLLDELREELGIGELIVYKHTPRLTDTPTLNALVRRHVRLCVGEQHASEFRRLGFDVDYTGLESAVERARVVVDCTPDGNGLAHKERYYSRFPGRSYIAEGSEAGFGKPYAAGVNEEALSPTEEYIHVVSCNTHSISAVTRTLAWREGVPALEWGHYVCIRRSSDVGQSGGVVPGVKVSGHHARFGSHHARDAHQLFATLGHDLNLFSSALQVNTQYMHVLHFHLRLTHPISREEVQERLVCNPAVSTTRKDTTNLVFAFGRDHSFHGRLLSQTVVCLPSLNVEGRDVVGYAFVPQDGNALLSNVMAVARSLRQSPVPVEERTAYLQRFVFPEV